MAAACVGRNRLAARPNPWNNPGLRDLPDRIARWDATAWELTASEYQATYGPLPFLPPDCQNAVVFQATQDGRLVSADPDAEHVVRSHAEFQQPFRGRSPPCMGRRLLQTRIAFLASGDVLRHPVRDVLATSRSWGGYSKWILALARGTGPCPAWTMPRRSRAFMLFLTISPPPCPGLERLGIPATPSEHVTLGVESGNPRFGPCTTGPGATMIFAAVVVRREARALA